MRAMWIDSHCHLDAGEFAADRDAVVERARSGGVAQMLLPAVEVANFEAVGRLAHAHGYAYALGIHPLYVGQAAHDALERLAGALEERRADPRLVAVGEIGLDHFVTDPDRARQERFYVEQLKLAQRFELPVVLHVRRSADALLKSLRRIAVRGGIVHAFNGSEQQARAFVDLGFRLGFGGAATFDRALQIRALLRSLPLSAIVVETDAPDIPPQWLYRTASERAAGRHARNEPGELPRIARTLAGLREWTLAETALITSTNACTALPRLKPLLGR